MKRILTFGTWLISVTAASIWFGWTDSFHRAYGCILLVVLVIAFLLFRKRRTVAPGDENLSRPMRFVVFGLLFAAATVAWLGVGLLIVRQIPGAANPFYDADRQLVEEKVNTLIAAGNYKEAARFIQERLETPATADFEGALVRLRYRTLIHAARRTDVTGASVLLTEAAGVAQKYKHHDLDDDLATTLLQQARRELQGRERIEQLRAKEAWEELAHLVRAMLDSQPQADDATARLAEYLVDATVERGKRCQDAVGKRKFFQEACDLAKQYHLKPEPAATLLAVSLKESEMKEHRERLLGKQMAGLKTQLTDAQTKYQAAVDASAKRERDLAEVTSKLQAIEFCLAEQSRLEIEGNRPVALPKGSQAGLLRFRMDAFPPVLVVEAWVDDAAGGPIRDLQAKDFQATLNGKPAKVAFAAQGQHEAQPLHVVLAIDVSGSMKGRPLDEAKKGAKEFLQRLPKEDVWIQILTFNGAAHRASHWSQDHSTAAISLDKLVAEGQTALFKAAGVALDDLADRSGQKKLGLFSDGIDNVGGVKIADLIARCQKEHVNVFTIGLKGEDLDVGILRKLSEETGGAYAEAASQQDLVAKFSLTSRLVSKQFYRLVLTPPQALLPRPSVLEVCVGRESTATFSARILER